MDWAVATAKEKGRILDQAEEFLGYNRASTIDRLLAHDRKRMELKGRTGTRR